MSNDLTVMERVRRALGRTEPLTIAPVPPVIDEPITRLVHTSIGLPELFAKNAAELKMYVSLVGVDELISQLIAFLREKKCKKIGVADSKLLEKIGIAQGLKSAGFDVKCWSELTADAAYELDAGVTDVWRAVAETGTLVIRPTQSHGRLLSLVPFVHVAIVEPRNFLPDMLDLFEEAAKEEDYRGTGLILISGPSKTADIEMNVVTGVHGPNIVKAFVLQ